MLISILYLINCQIPEYISLKNRSRKDRNAVSFKGGNKHEVYGISNNKKKETGITLVALVITVVRKTTAKLYSRRHFF